VTNASEINTARPYCAGLSNLSHDTEFLLVPASLQSRGDSFMKAQTSTVLAEAEHKQVNSQTHTLRVYIYIYIYIYISFFLVW
jgi:hypothetical protein